jgi:hypothetical protein
MIHGRFGNLAVGDSLAGLECKAAKLTLWVYIFSCCCRHLATMLRVK